MSVNMNQVWSQFDVSYGVALDLLPAELTPRCTRKKYAPEDVIINEGDTLRYVYFIESGVVDGMKRFENGKDYQYFKLDRFNGAIGLLELFSRQSTIIATIIANGYGETPIDFAAASAMGAISTAVAVLEINRPIAAHITNRQPSIRYGPLLPATSMSP